MKKDCEYTRQSLRKYLRGHLFKPEQMKIERHLQKCAFCRTEYEALKRSAETRKFLKDITPPEGVVQRVKAGVSVLSWFKTILYRPLWIVGIAGCAALLYFYVVVPLQRERELEMRELSAPPAAAVQPAPAGPGAAAPPAEHRAAQPVQPAVSAVDGPLVVTITAADERAAMRKINDVMQGHAVLRTMRFSEKVKEISGSLTARELETFFARIESAGRISYSRSRLESFPAAAPVPFVIRLKADQKAAAAPPAPQAAAQPAQKPAPQAQTTPAP